MIRAESLKCEEISNKDDPVEFDILYYNGEWGIAIKAHPIDRFDKNTVYVYHNAHHRPGDCRCIFTTGTYSDSCGLCKKKVPNDIAALKWMVGL